MPIILRPHLRYFFHRGGPIGRWSKVDCQATAVGCWRRPDACASRSPTPSDGAPTLVPSDGPVGRATSQPPVSQPTSLSPSRSLSRAHVEARARAPPRPLSPAHIPTYIHTYVRTYVQIRIIQGRVYKHAHTYTHTLAARLCASYTRAHAHGPSFFLAPSHPAEHPSSSRDDPARRGLHPANDTRGSPSSWLVPRGCSAFPNIHEASSRRRPHVRTHARTQHHRPRSRNTRILLSRLFSRQQPTDGAFHVRGVQLCPLQPTRDAVSFVFLPLPVLFAKNEGYVYIYIYIFGTRISIFFASVHRPRSNLARGEEEERVFPRVLFTTLLCCCCCCLCSVRGDPRGSCVRR